ncbi:hypothetical protein BAE44_0017845 [Dichanthelium oligosanthes]|uniref:Uncharacterized protein n=1 Tax=Dichanthelium oligosanthes TaxID=888268 RepID=A0A1E5V816_9POAL|nr:hypothetical protein BAE44_0017845 [Dichanthelium oligosanthes]
MGTWRRSWTAPLPLLRDSLRLLTSHGLSARDAARVFSAFPFPPDEPLRFLSADAPLPPRWFGPRASSPRPSPTCSVPRSSSSATASRSSGSRSRLRPRCSWRSPSSAPSSPSSSSSVMPRGSPTL